MAVKVYNDVTDAFICNTGLEHRHDHIINALETCSFKMQTQPYEKTLIVIIKSKTILHTNFLVN